MPRRAAVLAALVAVLGVAGLVSCGGGDDGLPHVTVRIGALEIDAEVARSADERALGLGGRDALPRDDGMLFDVEQPHPAKFWMKGMRFALDFVWINADRVVLETTEHVPPPAAGEEPELFGPDEDVLYVLEVNAGVVAEAGISAGDAVTFEPDIFAEGGG